MSSNEEYLDSLLKSIENRESDITESDVTESDVTESEIIDELTEPDNYMIEEEVVVPMDDDIFSALSDETPETFSEFESEISGEPEVFMEQEIPSEPELQFEPETSEELFKFEPEEPTDMLFGSEPVEFVEPEMTMDPDILVQSQETTVLDILQGNPNKLLSPEEIETIFANAEINFDQDDLEFNFDTADMSVFEPETEADVNGSLENVEVEESKEETKPVTAGANLFSDDVQNMAEDEIMRLLQQSADVSGEPENVNTDFLFDDTNISGDIAEIENLLDKADNNEPVSREVEEMLQLGLKVDNGEANSGAVAEAPQMLIGKIRTNFANIFRKSENKEKKPKEKKVKAKKSKEKKSFFLRKGKKNKKVQENIPENTPTTDTVGNLADLLSWDDSASVSNFPMWENVTDTESVPKAEEMFKTEGVFVSDNTQKKVDVPVRDEIPTGKGPSTVEDEFDEEDRLMMEAIRKAEAAKAAETSQAQPKGVGLDDLFGWGNDQDIPAAPMWDESFGEDEIPMMEETTDIFSENEPVEFVEQETTFGEAFTTSEDMPVWDEPQAGEDLSSLFESPQEQENVDLFGMEALSNDDFGVVNDFSDVNEIGQADFDGLVEGLLEQGPEVQTNNSDVTDMADLLASLENPESDEEMNDFTGDLFAGMEQEIENDSESESEFKFDFGEAEPEPEAEPEAETEVETEADSEEESEDEYPDVKGFKRRKRKLKKTKQKKEEKFADVENTEKQPGFFKKIFTILTEEMDEPENFGKGEGFEELGKTSDENKEALEQLDKEGPEDGKKKKKKDKKDKKGKKEKNEEADKAEGEDSEKESEAEEDKKKKKKPKKEKKEKKQKAPKFYEDSPKISKKKIKATVSVCIAVAAAILACCLFIPQLFELQNARDAYYDGDYATSYKELYGKKLSESDRIIFEKSEFMLALKRRVDTYYNYMAVNDEPRAVESLIQEVSNQETVLNEADKCGLAAEAQQSYQELLNILAEEYGVSEEEAIRICNYKQDALFTLHIRAIVAGEEFVCPDYLKEDYMNSVPVKTPEENVSEDVLEDILPEEEELTETEFEEGTD